MFGLPRGGGSNFKRIRRHVKSGLRVGLEPFVAKKRSSYRCFTCLCVLTGKGVALAVNDPEFGSQGLFG